MKILVTGSAGFIGAATAKALLEEGHTVVGLDNLNSYYDPRLKLARLAEAGLTPEAHGLVAHSRTYPAYRFVRLDLTDDKAIDALFESERFDAVVHLAAQAGVRYSIENPKAYIESNIVGFMNILEACRHHPVAHLVYASSSSIYGANDRVPFSEGDPTDAPESLYAATKKSDELLAATYARLYALRATGLRFFTVYGPWGRPDMAPFIFMKAISEGKPLRVFNHGHMRRDFTYIDDIVEGILRVLHHAPEGEVPHRVYNIGHGSPVDLLRFIHIIEELTGRKAILHMEPMQKGDVPLTYADTSRLERDCGYRPKVDIVEGLTRFHEWYQLRFAPQL